jgi:hypothetical protein
MSLRLQLVLVALLVSSTPSMANGAVTAWTDVTVRVYDANGVITGTTRPALDQARQTLSTASVEVIWRVCANDAAATSPCHAPMAPGELAIRIVRSSVPKGYRGTLPLGDAIIDTRTSAGVLATIYFDRVLWLATDSGIDVAALLGRAIAHELGHLLLASTRHGPVGLMRALWSQQEIRDGYSRDWTFAPGELRAIRTRALARQRLAAKSWGTK